jgi:hypothetical protein
VWTRARRTTRHLTHAAAVLALATFAAGCGGDENGQAADDARFVCIQEAQAKASAAVVARFYEQGAFGSAKDVEHELRSVPTPGFEPVSFLTPRGRMLAWSEMSDGQQATFDAWKRTHRVQEVVEEEELRAVRDARERAQETCPEAG